MERFNKGKIDNPFKKGDVVWHKLDRAKASENRKLSPKFDGPWKVEELITGTHNLNVDLVHINNPNLTRRTSIRKLKKAFLRPQIEPYKEELVTPAQPDIIVEDMDKEDSIPIQQIKKGPVINRKGTTLKKQRERAKQLNTVEDAREEFEVERIIDERIHPITKKKQYLVKWVGYHDKHNTWEPISNLTNSQELVKEWNSSKKISTTAKTIKKKK